MVEVLVELSSDQRELVADRPDQPRLEVPRLRLDVRVCRVNVEQLMDSPPYAR